MPFMKTTFLKRPWRGWGTTALGYAVIAAGLLATSSLSATVVNWVSGGPNPSEPAGVGVNGDGYRDGDIILDAEYNTPCGLAMDGTNYLYVADRDNDAVRLLKFDDNTTYHIAFEDQNYNEITNLFHKPVGVALDKTGGLLFVLNYGNGTDGSVLEIDANGIVATNLTKITNAGGIAVDSLNNIYVTAGNQVFKVAPSGISNIVATVTASGASLQGIVMKRSGPTAGLLAVCDTGRNGILLIDPNTGVITTNAGFHGAGDFFSANNVASSNNARFFQPTGVAEAGDGTLIVSDYGNHRVKVVLASGAVTNLYGVTSSDWLDPYPGFWDGTVVVPDQLGGVAARLPNGVVLAPDGSVYVTEDYYHIIRHVTEAGFQSQLPWPPAVAPIILTVTTNYGQVTLTWSAVAGATSYNVKRSQSSGSETTTITNITGTSYTDTTVLNGQTYYYVVSAVNAGGEGPPSNEVSATPPIPPPPAPRIGWFDYEGTPPYQTTVLHPVGTFIANNDLLIAVDPTMSGVSTYYTADSSVPSPTNGFTPPPYQDGWAFAQPLPVTTVPDLVIKAVNVGPGGSSSIVTAEFLFQVANPIIIGNNAAQFTVSDITSNVVFWYTIDGTNPTNALPSIGPIAIPNGNSVTLSINVSTNILFQARAFRNGYSPSGIASQSFSSSNSVPNSISFGFASGEASSDFVGSPGETFYAPVTLTILPSQAMYSLQFNVTVTNVAPAPSITPGAFGFQSMLMKPIPGTTPVVYTAILPEMFVSGTGFTNLVFTNLSLNLLGVGWLERAGKTNLYDTTKQTLIKYSQAHDDTFPTPTQPNGVMVGGYSFQVPGSATNGQTYQIQIGQPSATSDGIGAPGSSVYINTPTNGSLTAGAINSIKLVTAGQRKYLVGNVYPFRWFNAGDFGNTNLQNADVMQVFESAIYNWNNPPPGSDFFDAMDSCGCIGVLDGATGYYTNSFNLAATNVLFNGNDTTINQIAFGDTNLDVCDVYVTYRRSLDSNLTWYRRFWTNGVRVAETVPNVFNPSALKQSLSSSSKPQPAVVSSVTNQPQVNFACGDITNASSGQTVSIPITAQVFGNYPLRVLMLNLTVVPLDGSPALTTPVQFTANPALGQPYTTASIGNDNYSAVWLNSGISGLTGDATLGTLAVTIPATATGNAAYAIHFDHASASPNGIASFPKQTLTGLLTLSDRSSSTYNDGIPDSWRLRYFGTVNNLLSVSNACPTGDGVNNWQKYVAGVDPNTPNDFPSLNPKTPLPPGVTAAIYWPTVSGIRYVILHSSSLFPDSNWTAIATNTGTGMDMEFDDTITGQTQFYRVQILP